MDCLYTNCNANTGSGYDCFLVCWLCQRLGHPKRAGLTGRAADAVVDSSKRLRWSCPECRSRDIDFYRLFGQSKPGFMEIGKELACLAEKFAKYQKLFHDCEYLEGIGSPLNSNINKNKKIPATRSVASGPSPTSSVHILIPDAVPSTAPVMANSPVAPDDLDDLPSPNPLSLEKVATLPVHLDQTVPLVDRSGKLPGVSYADIVISSSPSASTLGSLSSVTTPSSSCKTVPSVIGASKASQSNDVAFYSVHNYLQIN
uniref:Uncharacterized protein n=1 Tax=Glossina brevipalpis TaxID=37001 RepID=A0A1A9X0V9_9MUSC